MKKPKARKAILDFHECRDFINEKYFKDKDLSNFAGKTYGNGKKASDNYPYQDFWHFIVDRGDVHNGSTIFISRDPWFGENNEWIWCKPIIEAFCDEFGDETEYWVEW